jgi:hypothetical protein
MQLRFVGTCAEVMGDRPLKLTRFGQQVDFPDEKLKDIVGEGGVALIPEVHFTDIGFTEAELKQVATPDKMTAAPADVKAKVAAAHEAAAKFAEGVL